MIDYKCRWQECKPEIETICILATKALNSNEEESSTLLKREKSHRRKTSPFSSSHAWGKLYHLLSHDCKQKLWHLKGNHHLLSLIEWDAKVIILPKQNGNILLLGKLSLTFPLNKIIHEISNSQSRKRNENFPTRRSAGKSHRLYGQAVEETEYSLREPKEKAKRSQKDHYMNCLCKADNMVRKTYLKRQKEKTKPRRNP